MVIDNPAATSWPAPPILAGRSAAAAGLGPDFMQANGNTNTIALSLLLRVPAHASLPAGEPALFVVRGRRVFHAAG